LLPCALASNTLEFKGEVSKMLDNAKYQQITVKVEQIVPGARPHLENWIKNNPEEFNRIAQECQASGNLDPIITRVKSLIASSASAAQGSMGSVQGGKPGKLS
jgi:hypothetical protein